MSLVFDILQKKKSSDAHLRHSGACLNFLSPATCQQMPIKRTLHVITFLTEKNKFFYILVSFFYAAFQWLCCALKLLILSSADGLTPLGLSRAWARCWAWYWAWYRAWYWARYWAQENCKMCDVCKSNRFKSSPAYSSNNQQATQLWDNIDWFSRGDICKIFIPSQLESQIGV